MKRTILLAAALIALGAALAPAAHGQTPAAAAKAAAPNEKWAGSWEGTFATDGPSGSMTTTITKGDPWKITAAMTGEVPPAGDTREISFDGDKVVWKQLYGEYDVTFKGTLNADGTVSGTIEANQGGSYVGGGTFTLKKKA